MSYYIISLKHTNKKDEFFTLWRADNKGYCQSINRAGVYENPEKGYHDGDGAIPVIMQTLEDLSFSLEIDGEKRSVIPNIPSVHRALNLKWVKGELTPIK